MKEPEPILFLRPAISGPITELKRPELKLPFGVLLREVWWILWST